MNPLLIAGLASLFLKGLGAFAGNKAKNAQQTEQNRASVAALNIQQQRSEDARRARLETGNSLLGHVSPTTAGGGVATHVNPLDPALFAKLDTPRTYDFASTMPKPGTGSTWDFLQGLFGGGAEVAAGMGNGPYVPAGVPAGVIGTDLPPDTGYPGNSSESTGLPPDSALTIDDLRKLMGSRNATPLGS